MSLEYQDNDNNITFIMVLTEFVWLLKHSLFNGKVSLFSFRTKLPSLIIPVMLLYLVAADGTPSIRCNTKALQGGVYRLAGEMLSTMVTQGGPSPKLLDAHTCRYIEVGTGTMPDRKSTRLNSSHTVISYAVFCLKKKNKTNNTNDKHFQFHHLRPYHSSSH